ncbi:MAG: AF1514 family protein [Gammaproteobacteria bacterium]|nr:AF1514 family protein [Gammaproteobacteria bacterium]
MEKRYLSLESSIINYAMAKHASEDIAKQLVADPMLVAWYDGIKKEEHPQIPECHPHEPGWLAYAKGHGGKVLVDVNQGTYIFIYT